MRIKNAYIIFLFIGFLSNAQTCPVISGPVNGDTNVPVDAIISWNQVSGINGYLISLGSTPGATEILNSRSAALVNSVTPIVGLPSNTEVFVTIGLFLEDGRLITCPGESFFTENITEPPPCTILSNPLNNAQNTNPGDDISWNYAYGATGYKLFVGTTAGGTDILNDFDVGNVLSFNPSENLPINTEIFVRIVPYNDIGNYGPCIEESFVTGDTSIDCEEFLPEITIPDSIGICGNNSAQIISSDDFALGFRWYKMDNDGTETMISEDREVNLTETGQYRYEAYRTISIFGENTECSNSKEFSVVASEMATIDDVVFTRESSGVQMAAEVSGNGNYEFSLDNPRGPYQDSNVFENVSKGDHTIFVRDKNGCGITERFVSQALNPDDFPNFFTPNGDGANDYWQFFPLFDNQISVQKIDIFDRYGSLLVQIDPASKGWNGSFNGKPMPATDYWFRAVSFDGQKIYGHFTLKR